MEETKEPPVPIDTDPTMENLQDNNPAPAGKGNPMQRITSSVKSAAKSVASKGSDKLSNPVKMVQQAASAAGNKAKQGGESLKRMANSAVKNSRRKEAGDVTPDSSDRKLTPPEDTEESKIMTPEPSPTKPPALKSPKSSKKKVKSTKSTMEGLVLDDHMIIWIAVASIAFLQTLENIGSVWRNSMPVSVLLAWMLVAFTAGLEMDGNVLIEEIKRRFLGHQFVEASKRDQHERETLTLSSTGGVSDRAVLNTLDHLPPGAAPHPSTSLWMRLFRHETPLDASTEHTSTRSATSLAHSRNVQHFAQRNMRFSSNLVQRLARFRRKQSDAKSSSESSSTTPVPGEVDAQQMGSMDFDQSNSDVLLSKMDVQPLCQLRGLDIFQTDCAEKEMSAHPYLLKNGLREVPTLFINLMLHWGSILIYFQLPDWVRDCTDSLEEDEGDSESTIALKRFLKGDDKYRQGRLKLVTEIVEAPYPVRLIAPKGRELSIFQPALFDLSFQQHDHAGTSCPVFEVTLDLMGSTAVRSMSSLIKRYLSDISMDVAAVITKPKGEKEDEPEACLGLWRFHHIELSQFPVLPDRFETDGCSGETLDAIRASILAKESSKIAVSARA